METELLDGGRLLVAKTHLPWLRANGLDSFERIMSAPEGQMRRDFPGRRTSRLEWRRPDGTTQAVFLKRYYPDYLSSGRKVLRRLGWPGSGDEARAEWDAVGQLVALGIPTLEVIACGQDSSSDRTVRSSFLMTAELTAAEEAHRYAARLSSTNRRRLLLRVAEMARRLHAAGLVHKDLYLGHYMVMPAAGAVYGGHVENGAEPRIALIDLQRVTRPRCCGRRWRVKDLAALLYSSLKAGATRSDVAAAFRVYRGNRRLDREHRALAKSVWRRVAWLKTRVPKHDTDFEQLGSLRR
jgi:hypothetical protein